MTKEELINYIKANGNQDDVVAMVKKMHAEGAAMTIEELDKRMKKREQALNKAFEMIEDNGPSDEEVLHAYVSKIDSSDVDDSVMRSQERVSANQKAAIIKSYVAMFFGLLLMIIVGYASGNIHPTSISVDVWQVVMMTLMMLGGFMFSLPLILATFKIYEKGGYPGWTCIIPIYSSVLLCQMAWGKGILVLLMFLPGVGGIFMLITNAKLATCFGKGMGFAVGFALLPPIFAPILGFDGSVYGGAE